MVVDLGEHGGGWSREEGWEGGEGEGERNSCHALEFIPSQLLVGAMPLFHAQVPFVSMFYLYCMYVYCTCAYVFRSSVVVSCCSNLKCHSARHLGCPFPRQHSGAPDAGEAEADARTGEAVGTRN